ncbi:MAG: hypothetical protein IKQ24_08340, partial [Verrucomicrobia bacterium]|nr:hypothetical protein [Verrucomicrobiota bacterium]
DFGAYTLEATNAQGTTVSEAVTVTKRSYVPGSWTEAVMMRNPLAFFRFDDTIDSSAGYVDDKGNPVTGYVTDFAGGNTGYYYDVYETDVVDGAIAQDSSKAVRFNGYSYVGTRLQLNSMAKSGFTTMGWVRRDSDLGSYTTRGGYFGQNDLNEFGDGNDTETIECWCAGIGNIKVKHGFVDKRWSMIVLTYDGSKLILYINGKVVGTASGTLSATAGTGYYFNVGGGGIFNNPATNMDYFFGDIDEIAMFDTCMTADDIQEFYFKGYYGPGSAPEITIQPANVESYENPEAAWTMSVTAGGTSPLSYQWYKDGTAIEDATDSTITGYFSGEYEGSYYVVVTNNYGTAKSDTATVTLRRVDPNSYEGVVVSLEPYAYWRFGEKSGTTAMEFINAYNGKYDSGQTLGQSGALKGDSNTAVLFDGTRYVTTTGMDLQSNTLTMAAWLKPNGSQVDFTEILFDRGSSAVGIDIAENQVCYHWNDSQYSFRSGLVLADGEWNFVVMAVSPTEATFYLGDQNGTLKSAQNVVTHDNARLTDKFAIGGYIDSAGSLTTRRFKGVIDEPVVFAHTLTAEEVTQLYQAGLSGTSSAPVIKTQPANAEGFVGEPITVSVSAIGTAPLTYVWTKDGEIIEGVNAATLVLAGEKADEGTYHVTVSNDFGTAVSMEAVVTLYYKPTSVDLTGDEYKLWTHLKFDNDLEDSSVNGNGGYDATYTGIGFDEGALGKAVVIKTDKETGDCHYVASTNPLYLGTEPITVAFWTKFITEAPNDLPWLCNSEDSFSNDGFTLAPGYAEAGSGYAPNGWSWSIQSWNDNTGINKYGPDNTIPAGEWHHLVFVMDPGKTMKVFQDGELVSTTDISSINVSDMWLDNDSYTMNIGQTGNGAYQESVEMLIDDMGIWRTALSDVNARSIYYAGINGNSFDEKKGDVKPEFILDPVGTTIYQIDSSIVTMTVDVKGTEPIEVTWIKDGEEVGTGLTLNVACVEGADGNYQAVAKNSAGEATSAVAKLEYRQPTSAYEELIVGFAPVAFWRFDDNIADGVAVDYVAHNNGVYHNMTSENQYEGAIAEDTSKSIHFNGTDTYISTPVQLNPLVEAGEFSVVGWVKRSSAYGEFTARGGYFGQNDQLEFGDGNNINQIEAWSPGAGQIKVDHHFVDNEWTQIILTYSWDETTMVEKLYLNGLLAYNNTKTSKMNSEGKSYFINIGGGGVFNSSGDYFRGDIDDVAVLSTALTEEDVNLLYNVGKYGPGAAPTVNVQPIGGEIYANDGTYTLSVRPAGTPPMTVKWYLNGNETAYEGESVQIARTAANAGSWTAKISNAYGSVESDAAVISFYQPKSDYEALVASLVPLAYWRLGEAEGTTAYEYASGFNGVYNEHQTLGAAGAIAKDTDTAVTFDGTSYASVPGMSFTSDTITMLAWIKPNGPINNYTGILFDRGNSAVGIDIVDNQPCYHWNDSQYSYRSGLYISEGEWSLIAMVVTPTEATFYLGDSAGTLTSAVNTVAHSPAKLTGAFSIGGDKNWSDRRFKGDIDEPAVFGYALSAAQIESIYKKGLGGDTPPTGPVLSFEMTELGLILTWEKGKLEIGETTEGPWIQIEKASNEGYIYNGESGTAYFRLVEE